MQRVNGKGEGPPIKKVGYTTPARNILIILSAVFVKINFKYYSMLTYKCLLPTPPDNLPKNLPTK